MSKVSLRFAFHFLSPRKARATPFAALMAEAISFALPVIRTWLGMEEYFHDSPPQTPPLGKEIYYNLLAKSKVGCLKPSVW